MLSFTQAFPFVQSITDTATDVLRSESPLRFGMIAARARGCAPEYRQLVTGTDMMEAQAQVIHNHLCNPDGAPFRFTLSRDPAEDMFGEPTTARHITLAVCFRPYIGSRQFGWNIKQPPATPTIVETARAVPRAWQIHTEFECEPPPVGGDDEELTCTRFPWRSGDDVADFTRRLHISMKGIAEGARFNGFGDTTPGQPVFDYLRNGPAGSKVSGPR